MTHISEEQLKSESTVEKAVIKIPEILSSPHDILGKEYEFNGVSFTVLGIEPVFFDDDSNDTTKDVQPGTVAIVNIQKQRIPVIPFQGGMAHITKIQIGEDVIVGYDEIIKHIEILDQAPQGWMTKGTLRKELKVNEKKVTTLANQYRSLNPEWFKNYWTPNGNHEHYAPELCELIRKELSRKEEAPEGWMTKEALASLIGRNYSQVKPEADKYRNLHPEWFKNYWTPNGNHEHYAPELRELIRKELSRKEEAPEGWMTKEALAYLIGRNYSQVKPEADKYRNLHPEWFHDYWTPNGNHEHYAPELCELIHKELSRKEEAPESWMTKEALRKELKVNEKKVTTFVNQYRSLNPEWFHDYKSKTHYTEHYAPQLCNLIRKEFSLQEYAPEGWMTNKNLAKEFKNNFKRVKLLANTYRFSHPEWFHDYKSKTHYTEHYAPQLCNLIRKELSRKEEAPEGWITKRGLTDELKSNHIRIVSGVDKYRLSNPEWFHDYWTPNGNHEHYAPELCNLIRKELSLQEYAPEGWMTNGGLVIELNKDSRAIKLIAYSYHSSNPEWFHWYKPNRGPFTEHYAPELCDLIRQAVNDKRS